MRIIGIDPGYAIVGFGVVDYAGSEFTTLEYGSIYTQAHTDFKKRLLDIHNDLLFILDKYKPDCMSIEKLFYFSNQKTVVDVAQARGVILVTARQNDLNIYEYTPLQVKQAVTGYGRADKIQVQRMVKMILNEEKLPKLDDITDSMAMAICHAHSCRFAQKL